MLRSGPARKYGSAPMPNMRPTRSFNCSYRNTATAATMTPDIWPIISPCFPEAAQEIEQQQQRPGHQNKAQAKLRTVAVASEQHVGGLLIAVVHRRPEQHGEGADDDAAFKARNKFAVVLVDAAAPYRQQDGDGDDHEHEENLHRQEDRIVRWQK